jgi:hypothetical protein
MIKSRTYVNTKWPVEVIKSRRVKWAGHGALVWEMKNSYKILVWKPQEVM